MIVCCIVLVKGVKKMDISNCIVKIADKDSGALHELYDTINKNIYSFALSILKNHDDALEVMQETFITIYNHADQYENKDKPMAWILTITKNLSYMRLRKNREMADIDDLVFSSEDNHDDKIFVKYLLDKLTSEERQIVVLHVVDGFRFHEIAKMLDLKLSTTLSKYHRAIKRIKEIVKEESI